MESDSHINKMTDSELIELSKAIGIPLTDRIVGRRRLIDKISASLKKRELTLEDFKPERLHDPAIKLENLSKHFGQTVAVDSLDLVLHPGEIVGLVGPNGAGKTTTMRMITGIIQPTEGSVSVNSYDIKKNPLKAKSVMGYIPERPTCYPSLRVKEYLSFISRIYEVPRVRSIQRIRKYVDLFQLNRYLNSYIGILSKGNLQRTLLAGVFVRDPPYILAFDEPIYGLDPRGAWSLKYHLKSLKSEGSAILISTHILEVAEGLCDRFVIMNEGLVVGNGTMEDLKEQNPGTNSLEEIFLQLTGGIPSIGD
jgi:ABC-2 type transport system ATP-binding protein